MEITSRATHLEADGSHDHHSLQLLVSFHPFPGWFKSRISQSIDQEPVVLHGKILVGSGPRHQTTFHFLSIVLIMFRWRSQFDTNMSLMPPPSSTQREQASDLEPSEGEVIWSQFNNVFYNIYFWWSLSIEGKWCWFSIYNRFGRLYSFESQPVVLSFAFFSLLGKWPAPEVGCVFILNLRVVRTHGPAPQSTHDQRERRMRNKPLLLATRWDAGAVCYCGET